MCQNFRFCVGQFALFIKSVFSGTRSNRSKNFFLQKMLHSTSLRSVKILGKFETVNPFCKQELLDNNQTYTQRLQLGSADDVM